MMQMSACAPSQLSELLSLITIGTMLFFSKGGKKHNPKDN